MRRPRSRRRLALCFTLVAAALGATGIAWAAFSNSTSNPSSTFTAKRIFPAERVTAAWDLDDAADGTAATVSYANAFLDGTLDVSGNWASTWSTTRYLEYELASPLPAGLSVSGVTFDFTFADNDTATGNQWCYYFETRKTSDGTLIQAHGSSGSTIGCEAAGVQTTISTPLAEITTTDQANDLTVRVYGMHSGGAKAVRVDRATVSGAGYAPFTLYANHDVDSSTGTATTAYWGPAKANSQSYTSTNWATAYSGTRYLGFTFPGYLPASATLTAASFEYVYRSSNGTDNVCYYFEVYSGGSLIGTHGSTSSDVDCNATASYETISTALAEVDTVAEANALVVKLYMKNVTGARASLTDAARLKLTYSLDAGTGCANPGTQTVTSSGDSWIQQDGGGTSNFGTDTLLDVKAQATKLRRALVTFGLPQLGAGCSVTGATLRLRLSTTGGTRTIDVYQVSSSWAESTVTWNTQPSTTGSPVSATTGAAGTWMTWNVLSIVQAQYAGTNNGFLVRDSVEDVNIVQTFESRENTNDPELVLTIG